jgi:hypothetical protein
LHTEKRVGDTVEMRGCGHKVKLNDVLCPMCGV